MAETTNIFLNANLTRYKLEDRLGSGGMARVYKAYDANLERPVAIKILHEHLADDPTFVERFKREAKIVANFNHPNIVQIYDFDVLKSESRQVLYMVMAFLPGKTLRDVLVDLNESEKRLPEQRVLEIMLDLTSALGYAHEHGMIHRDVKPANILFDDRGRAILTDFGIARMAENSQLTQEGITVGTPAYMSPEQATGLSVDGRTDIYALGIIFYELLTGTTPFEDDGSLSILLKHLNEPVPSLSKYDTTIDNPDLDAIVFKALAKDPDNRYRSAYEFEMDLKAAFANETPSYAFHQSEPSGTSQASSASIAAHEHTTQPQQTTPPEQAQKRKNRTPIGILSAGMFLIAVIILFSIINQNNTDAIPTETEIEVEGDGVSAVDSMTAMTVYFATDFTDGNTYNAYWPQDTMLNLEREILPDGGYQINSQREGQAIASIFEIGVDYDNHAIGLVGRLDEESARSSAYGIIFRYIDDDNYNVFAIDGAGRYSIWVRDDGNWIELRDADNTWTRDEAINTLGELNAIAVEIIDNEFFGYVNGQLVAQVTDDTIPTGKVGIYVAAPSNGGVVAQIDGYEVSETLDNLVESMTEMLPDELLDQINGSSS